LVISFIFVQIKRLIYFVGREGREGREERSQGWICTE